MGQEASFPVDEALEEQAKAPPSSVNPNTKKKLGFFKKPDFENREAARAAAAAGNLYDGAEEEDNNNIDDEEKKPSSLRPAGVAARNVISQMRNLNIGLRKGQQKDAQNWEKQWYEDEDDSEEEEEDEVPPPGLARPAMDVGHISAIPPQQPLYQPKPPPEHSRGIPALEAQTPPPPPPKDLLSGGDEWETQLQLDGGQKPNVQMFLPMLRVLGKGSFGKVVLVQKREGKEKGQLFAMKILKKAHLVKRRQIERTRTERKVLSVVNHPFIMKLHYAFQSPDKLYLVVDYCPGGELFFHLSRFRRFPERVARFYAAELLLAIGHLHKRGIIYRDLKPENVLLDAEGHVKLGDFGLAKAGIQHPFEGATSMCGTPEYMAPEVLAQVGHGFCVDYWGLGMIVYEMMTGLPPWYTTDRQQLFRRLKSAPLDIPTYFSVPAADFVGALLERNPRRRLGVTGIRVAMEHDFFRNISWRALYSRRVEAPVQPCEGWRPQDIEMATQNFDDQFTRMPVDSEDENKELIEELDENTFLGFSFDIVQQEKQLEAARLRSQNYHAS